MRMRSKSGHDNVQLHVRPLVVERVCAANVDFTCVSPDSQWCNKRVEVPASHQIRFVVVQLEPEP